jgi:hypothetical protein
VLIGGNAVVATSTLLMIEIGAMSPGFEIKAKVNSRLPPAYQRQVEPASMLHRTKALRSFDDEGPAVPKNKINMRT